MRFGSGGRARLDVPPPLVPQCEIHATTNVALLIMPFTSMLLLPLWDWSPLGDIIAATVQGVRVRMEAARLPSVGVVVLDDPVVIGRIRTRVLIHDRGAIPAIGIVPTDLNAPAGGGL